MPVWSEERRTAPVPTRTVPPWGRLPEAVKAAPDAVLWVLLASFFVLAAMPGGGRAGVLERLFAPRAEPWEAWAESDESNATRVDHSAWQRFLDRYLENGDDGLRLVAYARVPQVDRLALDRYIEALEHVPVRRLSRDEQFAYWVNLYNALTVALVLAHYPLDSIRDIDISPGFFADGPWGRKLVTIEGEGLSLNDIEHRILRPLWGDPRVHYALNCASIGCPALQPSAFTADNTEALLDTGAREYVNHPRGARVDRGRLRVSSIYVWFRDDFGKDDAAVVEHLLRYANPGLARSLQGITKISGDGYDWSLNDAGSVRSH